MVATSDPGVAEFLMGLGVGLLLGVASTLIVKSGLRSTGRRGDRDAEDFWKDARWDRSRGDYLQWQEEHLDDD